MAQNVVIDIDARTNRFEKALDELTAKVRSTAAQIDKAFSTTGSAEKSIKSTSNAVNELHSGLKEISLIAAGNVLAEGFEKAIGKIKQVGNEIYATTARMQSLEMGMKSLVTSDLVKTGQVKDYTEATAQAEVKTKELMDWFKELSLKSPYELMEVMESFKQNANMGQSVETAKKTTEAILALGAGLGMGQAEMKRFSAALAQTGATGRITAMDLRQFANNGFGMDKMNQIFGILSEKYNILIKDNNDFNKAIAEGKISTEDFFNALNTFALDNYGNAVDAMASTIEGLRSSLGDIKVSAINDLFLETSKTVSKTLAPYVEYLMKMLTGGDFSRWGEGINKWAQGILEPFQKIGATLENGTMSRAINMLKDFFSGKSLNLGAVKTMLSDIGGEEFADKWIEKIKEIRGYLDKFLEYKDQIISAIKGIGVALATAFAINKLSGFFGMLGKLNNPITRLTLLGAAFGVAWNKNLFEIQDKTQGVIQYIQSLISVFQKDGISGVLEKIKTDVSGVFDEIKNSVTQKWTDIQNAFQTNGFKGVFDLLVADIKPTLQKIWDGLPEGFKEKIQTIITDVTNFIQPIKNAIKSAFSYIGDLKELFDTEGIGAVVQKVFTDAVKGIKDVMKDILPENIVQTIEQVWGWIEKIGQAIAGIALGWGALNLIGGLMDVVNTVTLLYNGITGAAEVGGLLGTVLSTIGSIGLGSFSGIVGGVALFITALVEGFAILGQFINFGELLSNVFGTIKNSIQGVVEGIITNVAPKFKELLETLAPAGVAIAAMVTWLGTIILGAVNGLFKAIDDILAAVIDAADLIVSIVRLPFDIIVSLGAFIIGVVTGDTEKIKWAWENLVGRLEHIWNKFGAFLEDLLNGIVDFFRGIWETICDVVNSVDISAGLEKIFGAEVAQKFEEIRDKVLGFIEEIRSAWQHMLGLLNGDVVVMSNGQEISGKTYNAFDEKYGREVTLSRLANEGDQELFRQQFIKQDEITGEFVIDEKAANDAWNKYYGSNVSEESLFEEFTQSILNDIQSAVEKYDPNMKKSAESRRDYADKYVASKYDYVAEDPYLQSKVDGLYEQLGLNTAAVESNTQSTETNTKAEEESSKSKDGKPRSTAAENEAESKALIEFTKSQESLLQKATESIEQEFKDSISSNKEYNEDAIDQLKNILTKSQDNEYASLDTIQKSVSNWLLDDSVGVGLGDKTEKAVMDALNSATDKETYLALLRDIIVTLETGNEQLLQSTNNLTDELKEQKSENVKTIDDIVSKHVNSADEEKSGGLLSGLSSWIFGKKADDSFLKDTKDVDKDTEQSLKQVIDQLDVLGQIKELEENNLTGEEFQEAKDTYADILKQIGMSKDEIDDVNKILNDQNTSQTDLAVLLQNLYDLVNGIKATLPKQHYDDTDTYYQMESQLRSFIETELPKSLNDLKNELNGQPLAHMDKWIESMKYWTDLSNTKNMTEEQYAKFIESAINHSHLPQDIQDAYINAISTNGVDKTFIADYISTTLIPAIEEAGLVAAGGKDGQAMAAPTFKDEWSEGMQKGFDSMYSDFLLSNSYAISKGTEGLDEAGIALWMEKNGFTEQAYYDSLGEQQNYMETLGPVLQQVMDTVGFNSDFFAQIENVGTKEAQDYVASFDKYAELVNEVKNNQITNSDIMADKLESIFSVMADDESAQLLSQFISESENPKWTALFFSLLSGELDELKEKIGQEKIAYIGGGGANSNGDKPTSSASYSGTRGARKEYADELLAEYQKALASGDQILTTHYSDMLQGLVESTLDGKGGVWAGVDWWHVFEDPGRKQQWLDNYLTLGTSQAKGWTMEERQAWNEKQHLEQREAYEEELARLKELNPEEYERLSKEKKNNGLLGTLFGEDFDLSELFAQGLEGLSEFLNEDTIGAIQELFNIEIDAEKASSWHKMSTALSTLGTAMTGLRTGFGEDLTVPKRIFKILKEASELELNQDNISAWKDFSSMLKDLGNSLKTITGMFGDSTANITGLDPNAIAVPASNKLGNDIYSLFESLKNISDLEVNTDNIQNWNDFGNTMSNIGSSISSFISSFGNDSETITKLFTALQTASNKELDSDQISNWRELGKVISSLGNAVSNLILGFGGDVKKFNKMMNALKNFADVELDVTKIENWDSMQKVIASLGNAVGLFQKNFGEDIDIVKQKFGVLKGVAETELNKANIQNWSDFADSMASLGASVGSMIQAFGTSETGGISTEFINLLTNLSNITIDKESADSWTTFGNAITTLSGAISTIQTALGDTDGSSLTNIFTTLQQLAEAKLDEQNIASWTTFGSAIVNLGGAISTIMEALDESDDSALIGLFTTFQNMAMAQLDQNIIASWATFATAMSSIGTTIATIQTALGEGGEGADSGAAITGILQTLQQLAQAELDENSIASWLVFATAMETLGSTVAAIQSVLSETDDEGVAITGIFTALQQLATAELNEEIIAQWMNFANALQIIGDVITQLNALMGEGSALSANSEDGGIGGIFGLLFGGLDVESILALLSMFSPELLTGLMEFLTTEFDSNIIDSWTALGNALQIMADAISTIMIVLTGGELGEEGEIGTLGDEAVGATLIEGLEEFAKAAEVQAPIIDTILNPVLQKMANAMTTTVDKFMALADFWIGSRWKEAMKSFQKSGTEAAALTQALADKALEAEAAYLRWASAIWAVINALKALAAMGGGGGGGGSKGGGGGSKEYVPSTAVAGGTHNFRYGTAIVGEHGPELITNNTSQAWQVFSNNTLMDEIARTRHSLNLLSNSAEFVSYNRILGSNGGGTITNDNSQNINTTFGTIVGDDAFRAMVEDELTSVVRRELWLAR